MSGALSATAVDGMTVQLVQLNALFICSMAVQLSTIFAKEETSTRTAVALSTRISRWRWWGSGVVVVAGWAGLAVLTTGSATGLGLSIGLDDPAQYGPALTATAQLGLAALVVIAVAMALIAISTRLAPVAWAVVAWSVVVALRGDTLELDDWARQMSPLEWLGKVPVETWDAGGARILLMIAVVGLALSAVMFRRRSLIAS